MLTKNLADEVVHLKGDVPIIVGDLTKVNIFPVVDKGQPEVGKDDFGNQVVQQLLYEILQHATMKPK
jgi:hypothetical protein